MKIDRRLHLVVPIYGDEYQRIDENGHPVVDESGEPVLDQDVVAYAHSAPLSEETVERYHMVLGQTHAAIFSQGLGIASGPAHAMRVLRSLAKKSGTWGDDGAGLGVEHGLVEEIKRLTNVAALVDGKWQHLPLGLACERGFISNDDRMEVENAIAFFTVSYANTAQRVRRSLLTTAAGLWGARVISSDFTEFLSSLRTSIATDSSGEKSLAPAREEPASANATVDGRPSSVPY